MVGIDFRRQNQILTSKVGSRTEIIKLFLMAVDPYNIGIQTKRKELTKNTYDDFKLKNPLSSWFMQIYLSVARAKRANIARHLPHIFRDRVTLPDTVYFGCIVNLA